MNDFKQRFEPKQLSVITADPQVLAARYSPCGRFLIAGGYDGKVHRWDLAEKTHGEKAPAEKAPAEKAPAEKTPEEKAPEEKAPAKMPAIEGHHGWVQGLAFHPRAPLAFSADSWGAMEAWRYSNATPDATWRVETAHNGWIRDLAVSPDGDKLASCGLDQVVRIWSTADGTAIRELRGHQQDVYCLRFHPDGKSLVSGDDRGVIKQWDLATGEWVRDFDARTLHSLSRLQDVGGVKVLSFDRSGTTLACGGTTPKNGGTVVGIPTILLFNFASGQLTTTLKHGSENDCFVHDIVWHEAGFVMAVTCGTPGQGKLLFQRPEDAEPFFVSTKMANSQSLSIRPDGTQFAVVATNPGSNGNGRQLKNGQYVGNQSPIHLWTFPEA